MNSIRGLAALSVVVFHLKPFILNVVPESATLLPAINSGYFAVPLFFVLSGYATGTAYLPRLKQPSRKAMLHFWSRRLGRIYPTHLCMLLFVLVLIILGQWPYSGLQGLASNSFIANILLVQAWGLKSQLSWNYPAWAVSSLWLAYLLVPLLAHWAKNISHSQATILAILMMALSAAVYSVYEDLPFKHLISVLPTFMGGIALSIVCRKSNSSAQLQIAFLFFLLMLPFLVAPGKMQAALYIPLLFGLVYSLGVTTEGDPNYLHVPPLKRLGLISYSLYMSHSIPVSLGMLHLDAERWISVPICIRLAFVAAQLTAILGFAILVYYGIESPSKELVYKRSHRSFGA